jgi:protein N-terminal methyltransferase
MWRTELKDATGDADKTVDAVADKIASVSISSDASKDAAASCTVETSTLTWYSSANDYWEDASNCPLTDDGVLGGFAHVSPADVRDSTQFIAAVHKLRPGWRAGVAVDCGAGIGRVSKMLLLPMFEHVDLVEQSERLIRGARQYIGAQSPLLPKVRNLYCMGLQEFHPPDGSYDLVWIQWVSSHLTDADFVHFLRRCKASLSPHGWIGVKENVLLSGDPYDIDYQDSSITRSEVYYKSLFEQAGLTLLAEKKQKKFPKELFPVKMYALA